MDSFASRWTSEACIRLHMRQFAASDNYAGYNESERVGRKKKRKEEYGNKSERGR